MELYKDIHDEECDEHYHLGGDGYSEPVKQNIIFVKMIKLLKTISLGELKLRTNSPTSVNIVDNKNRTYVWLNLYRHYRGQWRIKIIKYERGETFFNKIFLPIIKNI